MFCIYNKHKQPGRVTYTYDDKISLFGCNVGMIPKMLRNQMSETQGEPYYWHIQVEKVLEQMGQSSQTIVIDLKPKERAKYLSFFELLDVWGVSKDEWTPMLLRLRCLLDEKVGKRNWKEFSLMDSDSNDFVYEFLYLRGSVKDGKTSGKWTHTFSTVSGALLWPDTLKYFTDCIRKTTPGVI